MNRSRVIFASLAVALGLLMVGAVLVIRFKQRLEPEQDAREMRRLGLVVRQYQAGHTDRSYIPAMDELDQWHRATEGRSLGDAFELEGVVWYGSVHMTDDPQLTMAEKRRGAYVIVLRQDGSVVLRPAIGTNAKVGETENALQR